MGDKSVDDKSVDDTTPARYTALPLPDYRHVPGRTPHPAKGPGGLSRGRPEASTRDLNTTPWPRCESYLYGLDLFNLGYWWECHEVLEALWLAAGLGTPAGHALQAVIQCAAAHLKIVSGQTAGAGPPARLAVPGDDPVPGDRTPDV